MSKRDAIFPAGKQALYEKNQYSAAIRSGDLLFVSGQVGSRADGSPEPEYGAQVQLAFDNLKAVLKACGDDLSTENILRQAYAIKDLELPMLLPGIKVNTSPTDHIPVEQMQFMRFNGKTWERFGELQTGN